MSKLETLKQMYDSGATADDIARALKVNDQWVAQAIATHVRTIEADAKAAVKAKLRKKTKAVPSAEARANRLAYMREYNRRPDVVARRKAQIAARKNCPAYKARRAAHQAKYDAKPEVKKKRRAYNRARYHRLKAEKLAAEKLAASEAQS